MLKPGDKIWHLTVIKHSFTSDRKRRHFLFRCDCGNEKIIQASNVTSGNTRSCGCLSKKIKHDRLLPSHKGVINQIILGYKRHAKDRNLLFNLTYEQVDKIIKTECFYCGTKDSNVKITKNCKKGYAYNGIDRIDSQKNYDIGNVVPCCKTCNKMKIDFPIDIFFHWIEKIYNYSINTAFKWQSNGASIS